MGERTELKVSMSDKNRRQYCKWTYDSDTSSWDTDCSEKFIFIDDGAPGDDGFIYCPYCSGRLIKAYSVEES